MTAPASKGMHPNRSDYPPAQPVECPGAPFMNPNSPRRRAGHYFRRIDGIWTCRYCETKAPRPT